MKKETFVKLVASLIEAQIRREELNHRLCDAVSLSRQDCIGEKLDFSDLIYDNKFEDAIIDIIEIEFGAYGRDRVTYYIYEQHDFSHYAFYDDTLSLEDLYDEITDNKYGKN